MASTAYPMTPNFSMLQDRSMDGGSDRKKRTRPLNSGSLILNNQENQLLYSLLGSENISLSAAVVELLVSEYGRWKQAERGVISLVKDYTNRAYFLRLYDLLSSKELLWEFKLYKNFQASLPRGCMNLITFEGENDGAVYGLNFSSTQEAEQFKRHLDKRHEQERKSGTVAVREQRSVAPANAVFSMGTPDSSFSNGVTPLGAAVAVPKQEKKPSSSFFTGKKKKDNKKPRIRKEDISNPTNFQHKAHVGWNQDSGFSNNVDSEPMDESIKNIIRAAGQDPNNLNKKTIKFVYDFIERYEEKVPESTPQSSSRHQAPPPPPPPPGPVSQPISQWSAPPPPPPSRNASYQAGPPSRPPPPPPGGSKFGSRPLPQTPNTPSDSYRPAGVPPPPPPPPPSLAPVSSNAPPAPPPPPPMLSGTVSSGAPPPPAPPPLSGLPAPQSGRGNLLAEIQAGKQLRSVNSSEKKPATNSDARGDVMAQIRQGAQLKHVDPAEQANRRSVPALADIGGIAGALAKALEERRNNMQLDDSSDDDDNSDEKNEWSD